MLEGSLLESKRRQDEVERAFDLENYLLQGKRILEDVMCGPASYHVLEPWTSAFSEYGEWRLRDGEPWDPMCTLPHPLPPELTPEEKWGSSRATTPQKPSSQGSKRGAQVDKSGSGSQGSMLRASTPERGSRGSILGGLTPEREPRQRPSQLSPTSPSSPLRVPPSPMTPMSPLSKGESKTLSPQNTGVVSFKS